MAKRVNLWINLINATVVEIRAKFRNPCVMCAHSFCGLAPEWTFCNRHICCTSSARSFKVI